MKVPKIVIVQCSEEIKEFRKNIKEIELVKDVSTLVEDIVECITCDHLEGSSIYVSASCASFIYENHSDRTEQFNDEAHLPLYAAALRLAGGIKNKLEYHHVYVDGMFPFTFKKFINNDTFYLIRP